MSIAEMARIIAHEFGHLFGLQHPDNGACQYAKRVRDLRLMAQQRSVALTGTKCSETNRVGRLARYITKPEMTRARTVAAMIMQEQQRRAQLNERAAPGPAIK
jgi:hypothetical protein